jgi:hypothetical protein
VITAPTAPEARPRATAVRGMPRRGYVGLLLAVLVLVIAALHVYPDVRFAVEHGGSVHLMAAAGEAMYLTRIGRVLDGDYRLGNAAIVEHRSDPFLLGPLPEYVLGTVGRLLGLSVTRLDLLATAVLPALIFLFVVGLLRAMTGRTRLPIVGGLAVVLGYYLISKETPLLSLRLVDPDLGRPLQFVGPVSPQFHYVIFLGALWLLYRVYAGRGGGASVLAAGVAVGLSFYLALYYWTFLLSGLLVWVLLEALRGDRERVRSGLAVIAIALVVGAYALVNGYRVLTTPAFPEAALRAGCVYSHRPILPYLHVGWIVLFGLWAWRHRDRVPERFVMFFLLAGVVCLNQQVVSGLTVQPFEWETQTNKLLLLLSFLVMVSAWLAACDTAVRPGPRVVTAVGALTAALLIAHAVALQSAYYSRHHDAYARMGREVGSLLTWLREATPPDAVVLANPASPVQSDLITTYGGRFAFVSEPFLAVSLIPQREIEDRYVVAMAAFGFGEDGLEQVLQHNRGALLLGSQALPQYVARHETAVAESVKRVGQRYRRILAGVEAAPASRFRLDYILATRAEAARLRGDVAAHAREIQGSEAFVILAVRP